MGKLLDSFESSQSLVKALSLLGALFHTRFCVCVEVSSCYSLYLDIIFLFLLKSEYENLLFFLLKFLRVLNLQ